MPNSLYNAAWPAITRLALGVLLAAAELTVCWGALHPDVDAEYRAHFIGKPTTCWIPPRLRNAARLQAPRDSFLVKDLVLPQGCAILRAGWMLEKWGAWSVGPAAILRLPVGKATRAVVLDLYAPSYFEHPQTVGIATAPGNTRVAAAIPPNSRVSVSIPLENADAVDGWVELYLTIGAPRSPGSMGLSGDERLLGVGLVAVRFVGA